MEQVNHPAHYNIPGRKECIDEMIDVFGINAVKTFCKLNAYKYRYRYQYKGGDIDIKKAEWYDQKFKDLEEIEK